jgi:two-component sensor histidine kinase
MWKESGGPSVEVPSHTGFGSRLINSSFGNGESCLAFHPDGLRCAFDVVL